MNHLINLYTEFTKNYKYDGNPLNVCTDCAGIETPLQALNILKIPYNHLFASEIDKNCIEFITRNFNPKKIYKDLKTRDNSIYANTDIDLYIAGFPCQPFSSCGIGKGFDDKIKGTIFFDVFSFIKTAEPNIFILENVKGLLTNKKGETYKTIISKLEELKQYDLHIKVLNTYDYGIPASRSRIYFVGIKKNLNKTFNFPKPFVSSISLNDLIEKKLPTTEIAVKQQKIMDDLVLNYPQYDFFDSKKIWVINLHVSSYKWVRPGKQNICPCLMTMCDYYSPVYKRYLSTNEVLLLQGILHKDYDFDFPKTKIYKFAGNTMSVNILVLLFRELFMNRTKIKINITKK
jgi:DNA (cytosine-5)-methyltransferase 1